MKQPSKIKILFDASPMVNGARSGIGYYVSALIQTLADNHPDDLELVGHYYNFLGRRRAVDLPHGSNIRYRPTILFPGKLPNMLRRLGWSIPFEWLIKERGDFHLFTAYLGWPSRHRTPSAVIIYDLAYLETPEYVAVRNQRDLERFVPPTIARASSIITISEASKSIISQNYPLSHRPVIVTYIPSVVAQKVGPTETEKIVKDLNINQPYILFVGTLEPRKNLVNLLLAYEQLPAELRDTYSLVLAGGKGWHDEAIVATYQKLQRQGLQVVTPGYVSEVQRSALYQRAALFTMSSSNEGFGMPILEAMAYGVPVAISDIPVFHEVAAEAAVYFDQTNPSAIAAAFTSLLRDTDRQQQLTRLGDKNLQRFDWKAVAESVYQQVKRTLNV